MLIFQRYTWWFAAMVGLVLMFSLAGQVGLFNPFQGLVLTVTSPLERGLNATFRPVASILSNAGEVGAVRAENARLRLENEQLRNQVAELQQNGQQIEELKLALNLSTDDPTLTRVAANIVHRDNSAFTDVVTIDKGSNAGIQVGMVVLSTRGTLMGKVTRVTSGNAFVRLITDTQSKVTAEVLGTGADGSVRGTPNRGLSFDLAQGEIHVGDTIVTAGLGGGFPRGLPIGTVSDVTGTSQDLYKKVTIEPGVRIGTAETVLVLTSFVPESLEIGP